MEGTCPVCGGTGRVPAGGNYYTRYLLAGYDAASDTVPCTNCGGQYMYGRPTGRVRLNTNGEPCVHRYRSRSVGRCLTEYTCDLCGDSYQIDSGD